MDDINEEVLSWAKESDEVLLEYVGRKLADEGPLGFMGGGFSAPASFAQDAQKWLDDSTSGIVEEYNENNRLSEEELAVSLADMLSSMFPAMPLGPLSLLIARRITNRRSATYEALGIEGVPEEEAYPVSENNLDKQDHLAQIFKRADEIAASTLKGRPAAGSDHPSRSAVRARIDDDVIDWLKTKNPQYTTQINAYLRALKEADEAVQGPSPD